MVAITEHVGAHQIVTTLLEELRWPLKVLANIAQTFYDTGYGATLDIYGWLLVSIPRDISHVDDLRRSLHEHGGDDLAAAREAEDLAFTLSLISGAACALGNNIRDFTNVDKTKQEEYREDLYDIMHLIDKHGEHLLETLVFPDSSEEGSSYSLCL